MEFIRKLFCCADIRERREKETRPYESRSESLKNKRPQSTPIHSPQRKAKHLPHPSSHPHVISHSVSHIAPQCNTFVKDIDGNTVIKHQNFIYLGYKFVESDDERDYSPSLHH